MGLGLSRRGEEFFIHNPQSINSAFLPGNFGESLLLILGISNAFVRSTAARGEGWRSSFSMLHSMAPE